MNCVAIPTAEEKPKLQILHNELGVATPTTQKNIVLANNNHKTQSLQRTTHLYCRSLEKERDRRTSRGLASCLRGERDEFLEYRERKPLQQQQQQLHQLQIQQCEANDDDSAGRTTGSVGAAGVITAGTCADGGLADAAGRSEYKSKTLPRIHFDTSINDTSLNEGKNY